jgi:hypothetical protein
MLDVNLPGGTLYSGSLQSGDMMPYPGNAIFKSRMVSRQALS